MVQVFFLEGRKLLQPLIDVLNQSPLVVIYINARGNVHGGNQRHPVAYTAGVDDLFHLRRDVNILAMLLGIEGEVFRMKFHACQLDNPFRRAVYMSQAAPVCEGASDSEWPKVECKLLPR